jgi:long-chain acyl-CoA synthetase
VTNADSERPSLAAIDASLTGAGSPYEIDVREIRGVPTRVWKHAPLNLPAVLRASCDHDGSEFVVFDDERITYAENYRRAAALADALAGHFGVQKGNRVAIAMRNYPEWFTAFWAPSPPERSWCH